MPDSDLPPPQPVPDLPHHHRPWLMVVGLVLVVFLSGGSLFWWYQPSVLLTVDGTSRKIYPKRGTVADLLQDQQIVLGPDDFVTPSSGTALTHNMPVKVTRVIKKESLVRVPMAPQVDWSMRTRQNLRRVLVQKGTAIDRVQRVEVIFHDGKEVNRRAWVVKTERRPFHTLTLFNDKGFPAKKYDLLKVPTFKMLATGYFVGEPMVPSDETFLGHKLQRGLVAIDPKVIPLRSRLYIPGYGYAYASDTGSAIKGLRIDLAVSGRKEELRYNHRRVTVYVLEQARKW